MNKVNELVAFLARETGWTLEYIRAIPLSQLNALVEELRYQKAMDEYKAAYNAALIVATLASTSKRKVKPQDIIGPPPERAQKKVKESDIWKLAQKAGILIPKDRI